VYTCYIVTDVMYHTQRCFTVNTRIDPEVLSHKLEIA